jgi:uncharacterized protein (TIGR04222 family)
MQNTFQNNLYQRLQDFELDDPTHEFGFTRHLMKSQGWTMVYAQRVIVEYKKFAFLAVVANHQVVPSDQVDQVWHSHVLLTQSYWEEFCPQVLGRKLHHHPARGGQTERSEFHDFYVQTIVSYRHFFGSPPTDIWSPPDLRFGAELKMQRVNLINNWVIPKSLPQMPLARSVSILGIATIITMVTARRVNAATEDFLEKYWNLTFEQGIAIWCMSIVLGLMLRYVIRLPLKQPHKPELDIYQIAYLAGGCQRAIELAIVQLVHEGYLSPSVGYRSFSIEKLLPNDATLLQKQVMQQVHLTPEFKDLRGAEKYQTNFLYQQLQQENLLMKGWPLMIGFSWVILVSITGLSLFMSIFIRQALRESLYEIALPIWFIAFTFTLCCFVLSTKTLWGSRILANLKKNHDVYDVTQRFALYGYTVLSGGALDDLNQIFSAQVQADRDSACGCGC